MKNRRWRMYICGFITVGIVVTAFFYAKYSNSRAIGASSSDFIKWVDFDVTSEALKYACKLDVESYSDEIHLDWITLLAYAAVRGGGKFDGKSIDYIDEVAKQLKDGTVSKEKLMEKYKHYSYYCEAYEAVLGGMVGDFFEIQDDGSKVAKYGLKAYSPIAKGFEYQDYDDFGVSRSFGYKRQHLGHDMMGLIGTPIIACESGYVEALGWNRYGGWRIGVRSFDKKRYYYYAHLRQNRPYAEGLKEGDIVTAGDVIGYMGHTGYSDKENVNNIQTVHLHVGLQIIFDESQKDGNGEIWVDFYQLSKFLSNHRQEVIRDELTKEWKRSKFMEDRTVIEYINE